ncbi:peptidyl-tRNA hydrolase [Piedraia hortae CBS 480.64]|uniref:peptidyl-tRNA hydrolase n=1 Tax=Piedraia hortae CBS 480.64 TaxID=1314780 RepID=A0A6A7C3N2_9PEZI|nr:peptidyl-tRNA hydrolase [Piedraia hortae CBS 480.64]
MSHIASPLRLLICSLGNPGPTYANTLHSAGHTVLQKLASQLGYGEFKKERMLGKGLVARPANDKNWTLWQSTSYMNTSGPDIRDAFRAWSNEGEQGRLVIVYDELEKPLGTVAVRTAPGLSARGHNGIKSVQNSLGNTPFTRIGIGIGRPDSRNSGVVAQYVLRKMTYVEKEKIEACVDELAQKLVELQGE